MDHCAMVGVANFGMQKFSVCSAQTADYIVAARTILITLKNEFSMWGCAL